MKVVVSVFNNLYTDQRVEKVCKTLSENGFDLFLIGNTWQGAPTLSRHYPTFRIGIKSSILRFAYLEFQWKLYKKLLREADSDTILLSNDLDTLLPNYLVARKKNIPLVFDSHEIFTEMPAVAGRWVQHVWRLLERRLLPRVKFMYTESESYAEWFAQQYRIPKPVVVRNIPRKLQAPSALPENRPKIVMYQGALNPSRGIDKAIRAMAYLPEAVLIIAGDGPKRKEFETLAQQLYPPEKVTFLGNLKPDELRIVTRTADVGLSIEENGGVSYLFSLPNKVADNIQSRVPLVMINFPEMLRIKEKYNIGEITESHEPEVIANKIREVLAKGRKFYLPELNKAAEEYCWENEETKLLEVFRNAASELK